MAKESHHAWLDKYPIHSKDHEPELEAHAAILELRHKMPKDLAEAKAHEHYLKDRALDVAAHHLQGIRAAHAAGENDAAKQHGEAYAAAAKHLGFDPFDKPHQDIVDRIKTSGPKVYDFKAHPSDSLFHTKEDEEEKSPEDDRIAMFMEGLENLKTKLKEHEKVEKAEEDLEKSKNVREQTSNITPVDADRRRVQYARSIGLQPVRSAGKSFSASKGFPRASGNKLPYSNDFDVAHETAHAMTTPSDKTVEQHQQYLTDHARPTKHNSRSNPDFEHRETQRQENVANHLENRIDRRAGVRPAKFRSQVRTSVVLPHKQEPPKEWVNNEASWGAVKDKRPHANQGEDIEVPGDSIKEASKAFADRFDRGAKFDKRGNVVPGSGIDQRVNSAHSGVNWLKAVRAKFGKQNG